MPQAVAVDVHGLSMNTSISLRAGFWKQTILSVQPMVTMHQTYLPITKTQPTLCGLVNTRPIAAAMNGLDMDVIGTMH